MGNHNRQPFDFSAAFDAAPDDEKQIITEMLTSGLRDVTLLRYCQRRLPEHAHMLDGEIERAEMKEKILLFPDDLVRLAVLIDGITE